MTVIIKLSTLTAVIEELVICQTIEIKDWTMTGLRNLHDTKISQLSNVQFDSCQMSNLTTDDGFYA